MKTARHPKHCAFTVSLAVSAIILCGGLTPGFGQDAFFDNSLHHGARGMSAAYERSDGLFHLTKVPYDQLDCRNCHVKTCDQCHGSEENGRFIYSVAKAMDPNTCLSQCHGKQGLTFMLGQETGQPDVHIARGMGCSDCHEAEDMHGDGQEYASIRVFGAIKATCEGCHQDKPAIKSHEVHKGKLHCTACHVSTSISCQNCHFESFLKTGTREGNFFLSNSWLLLMNHKGRVTAGTAMSFVANNRKLMVYSPQFTHAVQEKGRSCEACHANEAVRLIQQGKKIPMMGFAQGEIAPWKGVVPAVHENLEWQYFNKSGEKWIPLNTKETDNVQWWYSSPITPGQLESLAKENP